MAKPNPQMQASLREFGGDPHGGVGLGPGRDQRGVGGELVAPHRDHGHGFGAAGEDDVPVSGDDPLASHGHSKADAQRIKQLIEEYQALPSNRTGGQRSG